VRGLGSHGFTEFENLERTCLQSVNDSSNLSPYHRRDVYFNACPHWLISEEEEKGNFTVLSGLEGKSSFDDYS
jgi:hypothetical protein